MRTDFLRGSWVALVTPFTEDGKIDYKAFEKLITMQVAARTDGLLICGTTGEAVTLSFDEKKSLMQAAKELTAGKVPLMFGSGGNDTRAVADLTSKAASLGADAVLVVTPYYNKPPQDGLKIHYRAVSESTDLPVILYNVPGRTGCNMLPDTVLSLSEIPNIVAVKEASGNLEQVMEIIRRAPENFALFSGDDALNLPIMACGGVGTISVTANVAPFMMKKFNDAALSQDWQQARAIHYHLLELHRGLFVESNPLPAKAALANAGLMEDFTRPPLCRPSQKTHELMKKLTSGLE
ncbi:MAG: 4-hydroxy-tetrahydrodipicolinate synthase [Candidatus Riflebacteria bacterium]|nr:4-hydroxy-tetrahydrodipicolinate synthase [Candidatus Riflebacteria bacterium]